jgi:hypothetical protein
VGLDLAREETDGTKARITVVPKANAANKKVAITATGINTNASKPVSGANQRGN